MGLIEAAAASRFWKPRADDLAQANRQMSAQARDLEKRQQQMRLATQEIQRVHAALARGDWSARARVDERDLLSIATSLNLLLDRLTRLIQRDTQFARQEQATHQLALAIQMWRSGQPGKLPEYTGTALDEVILELERLRMQPRPAGQGAQASTR